MAVARSEPFRDQVCTLGICDGSGWILGPEDVARPCDCRAPRLRRNRTRGVSSRLPAKYRGVSFDRPPVPNLPREAVRSTRLYVDNLDANLASGRGIWFLGDIGTGKTTLAMLISKIALERSHSVAIFSTTKLLSRIRSTYRADKGDPYSDLFDELTTVDLLFIDDLGAERQTDWVIEQLYSIVNERYETEKAIIFTANSDQLNVEEEKKVDRGRPELEVERQIGRRTFSRLNEMCGDPVMLLGEDHRSQGAPSATVIDLAP